MDATEQRATTGRWTVANGHGEYDIMGETAICRMYQDRAINSNLTPDAANARLIVAAVNAVREAGYTVSELEAGAVKRDRGLADLKWANATDLLAVLPPEATS